MRAANVLLSFVFIAACSDGAPVDDAGAEGDAGSPHDDAGVTDDAGTTAPDAGGDGDDAGTPIASFTLGGARPVDVFVPEGTTTTSEPLPLLIFLHGYGTTGAFMESVLDVTSHAAARGFLYAHPEGTADGSGAQFWNASQACCDFYQTGVDDSAYLMGLVDEIATRAPVDAARVYFMGHSNGGFMSARMACDHASRVAAVVNISGAMMNAVDTCAPDDTVAMLHVHGTVDTTILYDGATVQGVTYPGALESATKWATLMGCSTTGAPGDTALDLDQAVPGAETNTLLFDEGCDAGGRAALYTIEGGSHTPTPSSRFLPELLDFLFAHAKQ